MVLSFDFTENATRGQIFDTLFNAMDEAQHKRFYEIIERAEVPEKHHHDIGEINKTIDALDAPDQVKNDLRSVYAILAAAEAKVHGCDVSQTHFHEVGKAGGIRNALAICAEFYVLAPEEVVATPHSARRRRNRMRSWCAFAARSRNCRYPRGYAAR